MDEMILKIKEGIEVSAFDDGEENKTYLIRLNNRHWKVSETIFCVLNSIDGKRTISEIKNYLYDTYYIQLEEQKLNQIIDAAFVKNGILEGTKAESEPPRNKMLWGRFTLFKPGIITKFKPASVFFRKESMLPLGSGVIIWLVYLYSVNSNKEVVDTLFQLNIADIILCYLFIFITGIIHEFGHSIAAMSFGVMPGRIGAGIYFIMPVLFSDVTTVWKLKRQQRAIVDLGGIYLQGVFLLIFFLINTFAVKSNLMTIGILISGFQILGNLNPFIKLDGYWLLSDFLGITEIRSFIGRVWADIFRKILGKKQNSAQISKGKRAVIYIYSIFAAVFFLSFFRFLAQSFLVAVENIRTDIITLSQMSPYLVNITFSSIVQYLSMRITTIIVLIFFLRFLWSFILKKLITRLTHKKGI